MALFLFFFSFFPAWPGINGETQLQNEECQSGMHCKGKEQSLPVCPAGFFCPGGNPTVEPVPCPPGTFRSEALPSHSCLPCPVHFFSPRPGQKSCFPCGSEAEQPAEGQHTCVCLGRGQVFQPRDALCTCPPGFGRDGRDGRSCIPKSAPACRAPASRSQEGLCLSPAAWAGYCSRQVCADPKDFQGYDKVLGLCICRSDSLEEICNFGCRRHQKSTLQLTCAGGKAQLLITHSNGSKTAVFLEGLRKVLPKPNFSLEDVCAAGGQTHPAHIVEMSEKGFLGVYNPDPQLIHELLVLNEAPSLHEMSLPPAHAGPEGCRDQSLNPPNPKSQPQFQSIPNPTSLDQNPPNPLNSTPQPEFQGTQNHTSQDLNPPNSTSQPEFLDQNPPTPHPTFQGIPNPTSLDQNPSNPKSQPEFLDQNPPASQPEFHSIPNLTSMDQNPPTPSNSTSQPEFLDQNPLNSPSRPKFQGIPNPTSLDLNPSNPKSQPEFLDQNPLNSPSSPRFQGIPNPTSLDQNPPNPPNSTSHPKFLDQNPPTPHPTFQGVPNPTSLDQNPSNPKSQPEFLDQNPPTSQPEFHSIPNPTSLDQNPSNPKSQLEFLDQNPLNSPSYPRFQGIPNPTSLDQNPPNPPNSTSHPEFLDQNPPTPHPTFQGKPNPTSLDLNPPNPPNSTPHPKFRGILNPSACLGSASLLFLLSPQHFPVYDVNNLYNTNAEFDWGDFRSLEEEIREIPRNSQDLLLFLFHFQAPGTYVLHLSSNKHKRMYVRVMPAGGQCRQDGPFFPSTPRALVQLGLAQLSPAQGKELLHPEPMLSAAAATALLLLLLLPLLCRGQRRSRPSPAFRRRQLRHRAHIPGSGRESAHPAPRSREAAAGTAWEPEGQIDLDSFNTKVFFELLLRQAQAVTSTLGHLKEEVKVVYHRVLSEISSLKNLWIKALSIPGEGEDAEMAKEQVPSSGSFETPEISRFYGISGVSSHPWELIPQKLIPLLQAVLQLLEEHRKNNFSPETPGSTLKASAARTEGLKSEENHKPTPPAAMNSPSPAGRITHTQREMQTSLELDTASALSPAELEEKVDALTEELLQVLQEEQQFLSTQGNEDLLSYYLEITSLEKESLVQQIDALEEEIAQGRKL